MAIRLAIVLDFPNMPGDLSHENAVRQIMRDMGRGKYPIKGVEIGEYEADDPKLLMDPVPLDKPLTLQKQVPLIPVNDKTNVLEQLTMCQIIRVLRNKETNGRKKKAVYGLIAEWVYQYQQDCVSSDAATEFYNAFKPNEEER